MTLKTQRKLAGKILKCGPHRIKFDESRLDEIKEAITKASVRGLIATGAISRKPVKGISRARTRAAHIQDRKGRGKGPTKRKGKSTARLSTKTMWVNRIRLIRKFLTELRGKQTITPKDFRMLYLKAKGGFFRSKRHLSLYLAEQGLVKKR